jgi:hypothetical protein
MNLNLQTPICPSCDANLDIISGQSIAKCRYCKTETVINSIVDQQKLAKDISDLNSNYTSLVKAIVGEEVKEDTTIKQDTIVITKEQKRNRRKYLFFLMLSAISLFIGVDYHVLGIFLNGMLLLTANKFSLKRLVVFNTLAIIAELIYLIVSLL